jgi:hypothetical protein
MNVKAVFVGINKHIDPGISELGGARRDATALWALFSDTIDGMAARLLLDEGTTHAEVSEAILGTLGAAGPDDIVVIMRTAVETIFVGRERAYNRRFLSDVQPLSRRSGGA